MDTDVLLTEEYNKGFRAGRMFAEQQHDQVLFRTYAGQAMQGILSCNGQNWYPQSTPEALAQCAVQTAQALLAEVKRLEAENGC